MGELHEHWVNLRSASPSHTRVRLVAMLGTVLFLLPLMLVGDAGPVAWVGTLVLGALVIYQPHGAMPTVFVLWAIGSWWAETDGVWHWALLPAAWGLLLVHASAALADSVPPQASLPRSVLVLNALRVLLVGAATILIWGVAGLLGGQTGTNVLPGVIGLALLVAALIGYVSLRPRPTSV